MTLSFLVSFSCILTGKKEHSANLMKATLEADDVSFISAINNEIQMEPAQWGKIKKQLPYYGKTDNFIKKSIYININEFRIKKHLEVSPDDKDVFDEILNDENKTYETIENILLKKIKKNH